MLQRVGDALDATQAAQTTQMILEQNIIAQQTASSVGNLTAAQGQATIITKSYTEKNRAR